jgi:hypothetical protein
MLFREFSKNRVRLGNRLWDQGEIIISHIIKSYIYYDYESVDHWFSEIVTALRRVPTLKGSHKYPKKEFIYNNMWGDNLAEEGDYEATKKMIETEWEDILFEYCENGDFERREYDEMDITNIFTFCEEYFEWLSTKLSKEGDIPRREVYNKLKDLLEEFHYSSYIK